MSLLDPVLSPVVHALAAVLAAAHDLVAGLLPDLPAGAAWTASVVLLVAAVRVLLLPLVVHGVRQAHAGARARPALRALAAQHGRPRTPEALAAYRTARTEVAREHGVPRLGCLPLLAQAPVWIGLHHLLAGVADGVPVGALDTVLVASFAAASLAGVPLVAQGYAGGPAHLALVAGLAWTAALLGYVTQRLLVAPNQPLADLPEAVARVQAALPLVTAAGLLVTAGFVPVALLVYWVANGAWTCAQSAVVRRWFPTPGSPAALSRAPR